MNGGNMDNLTNWTMARACGVRGEDAAQELRGPILPYGSDPVSKGIRAMEGRMIDHGIPPEVAAERARNLAAALQDGVEEVVPTVAASLQRTLERRNQVIAIDVATAWLETQLRELPVREESE